jgi:Acetyltransferases
MVALTLPSLLTGEAANQALRAHHAPPGNMGDADLVMASGGEALCWWRVLAPEAELLWLHVHEDMRAKGLAGRLLVASLEHLEAAHLVKKYMLEVSVNNIQAFYLYKKIGFEVVGVRKKYYQDKASGITSDAYVMSCSTFDSSY